MELTTMEIEMVEKAVASVEGQVYELGDLQLALVGGGSGDTIAH